MFRFTIRDVLWLTVVVALGVAWWADRGRIDWERARWRRLRESNEEKENELAKKQIELDELKYKLREDYISELKKESEAVLQHLRQSTEDGKMQHDLRFFPPEPPSGNSL